LEQRLYFSQDRSNELLTPTRSRDFRVSRFLFLQCVRKKKCVTIARLGIAQCVNYRQLFEIRAIIVSGTHN